MAVVVPSSDSVNYQAYLAVSNIKTSITNTSSSPHNVALQQRLTAAQAELVTSLMASSKVGAAAFLAAASYNT
jgi:hypothetical protein